MIDTKQLGPEAQTVTNAQGGRQSDTVARLDLFPAAAHLHVGQILKAGAVKYGEDNWKLIEARSHLNHALVHAAAWLAGDKSDDHIGHFACRAMMALEMYLKEITDETLSGGKVRAEAGATAVRAGASRARASGHRPMAGRRTRGE